MEQHQNPNTDKSTLLLLVLGMFFLTNVILAELIGVKLFSLEETFGFKPFNWNLFGISGSLNFTVGVILWPLVFIMTDILNEYYGVKGVRRLSYIAVALVSYAFIMIYAAINVAPAGFWVSTNVDKGVPNMQTAYAVIYGQGLWIIGGSIIAFLFGQLVDVTAFHKIKKVTGEKSIWLRATGSTVISQLFDSIIVLYVAFVIPGSWTLNQFFAFALVNYIYKLSAAVALTPALYWVHNIIDKFLGKELSEKMRAEAMKN
jgi:uncharacterized integral membrane protein (TIGR00697 family)